MRHLLVEAASVPLTLASALGDSCGGRRRGSSPDTTRQVAAQDVRSRSPDTVLEGVVTGDEQGLCQPTGKHAGLEMAVPKPSGLEGSVEAHPRELDAVEDDLLLTISRCPLCRTPVRCE